MTTSHRTSGAARGQAPRCAASLMCPTASSTVHESVHDLACCVSSVGGTSKKDCKKDRPQTHIGRKLGALARRLIGARAPAIIDTGATRHVSGVKDYFPSNLVTDHSPSGGVRIADGSTLPIEAVGKMVMYTPSYNKKHDRAELCKLELSDALYVPGMDVTLISPRAAFENEGTRTYFNEDNYMELSDETIIPLWLDQNTMGWL